MLRKPLFWIVLIVIIAILWFIFMGPRKVTTTNGTTAPATTTTPAQTTPDQKTSQTDQPSDASQAAANANQSTTQQQ